MSVSIAPPHLIHSSTPPVAPTFPASADAVVSTAATDGRIILWDLSQLVGLAPADAEALQAAAAGPPAGR